MTTRKYKYPTPPATQCAHCGKRLRSWYNDMHRACEAEYFAILETPEFQAEFTASEPEDTGERLIGFPEAMWCSSCHRLDNSIQPKRICGCGAPMVLASSVLGR